MEILHSFSSSFCSESIDKITEKLITNKNKKINNKKSAFYTTTCCTGVFYYIWFYAVVSALFTSVLLSRLVIRAWK